MKIHWWIPAFLRSQSSVASTTKEPYKLIIATPRAKRAFNLVGGNASTEIRLPAVLVTTHKRVIREILIRRDYAAADNYYHLVRHCYARTAYEQLRLTYWKRHRDEVLSELTAALHNFQFEQADKFARHNAMVVIPDEYQALRLPYWQQHRNEVLTALAALLRDFRFKSANELALRYATVVTPNEYRQIKAKSIQRFLRTTFEQEVNDEQATALACLARNVLVKARAGSGKTSTIVSRAALAIYEEDLHPNQVLMLAFNQDAASEMRRRMRENFGFSEFATARTFHSLAYRIVNPTKELISEDDLSLQLTENAIRAVWSSSFRKLVNAFFRIAETADLLPDRTLDDAAYFDFRRTDLKLFTLSGVRVKSTGEKWIADFLYEHDIRFNYERYFYWSGAPYRPDFTLIGSAPSFSVLAILEHWGVSSKDKDSDEIFGGSMTAGEYRRQMAAKRDYWAKKEMLLLETSVEDLWQGREAFEATLKAKLEANGILCKRLPEAELQRNLERRYWNEMSRLLLQFIRRAKNRRLRPEDVRRILHGIPKTKVKMRIFWSLAWRVYIAYEKTLERSHMMDFQDLLEDAAMRIDEEEGEIAFVPEHGKDQVYLNELRWLLIDEYQDFSPGFDRLVNVMRKHNPKLRLFCVGDDWQTINRFVGSEPLYFREFTKSLDNAEQVMLRTNHRSLPVIVDTSNCLMAGFGEPGTYKPNKRTGRVFISCIDKLRLPDQAIFAPDDLDDPVSSDEVATTTRKFDPGFMRKRCIAVCRGLLWSWRDLDKSVAILCRTNYIYGSTLFEFSKELSDSLDEMKISSAEFRISTIHSYKGLQADLVILLDVTSGQIPLLHKDNSLLAPFLSEGADPYEEALIDERRLFYVALSRAAEQLYILSETGRLSPFLYDLSIPIIQPSKIVGQALADRRTMQLSNG